MRMPMARSLWAPLLLIASFPASAGFYARSELSAAAAIVPLGRGFQISGAAGSDVSGKPAIAGNGEHFFVVWKDQRNSSTSAHDVFGARVSHDGTVLDPNGIPISTSLGDLQITAVPSVAFDGANYLVVWVGTIPGTGDNEIFAARVTQEGTVLDVPERQVTSGADPRPRPISLAFDGSNYLVAWRTDGDRIHGLRVSTAGESLDGPLGFPIATGGGDFYPWVAFSGGNHFVVWHGWGTNGLDIFGARVTPGGTVLDPEGFVLLGSAHGFSPPGAFVRRGKTLHELAQRRFALPSGGVDPVAPKADSRDGSRLHLPWVLVRRVPPSQRRMAIPASTDRTIPARPLCIRSSRSTSTTSKLYGRTDSRRNSDSGEASSMTSSPDTLTAALSKRVSQG